MSIYGRTDVVVHVDMNDIREAKQQEQYAKQQRAAAVRAEKQARQRQHQARVAADAQNADYRSRYNAARAFLVVWVLAVVVGSFRGCWMLVCNAECGEATDKDGNTGFFNSMTADSAQTRANNGGGWGSGRGTWNTECRNCMHQYCYNLNHKEHDDDDVAPSMRPFYLYCSAVVLGLITGAKVWSLTGCCGFESEYTFSSQARNLRSWMCKCDPDRHEKDTGCNAVIWLSVCGVGLFFAAAGGFWADV